MLLNAVSSTCEKAEHFGPFPSCFCPRDSTKARLFAKACAQMSDSSNTRPWQLSLDLLLLAPMLGLESLGGDSHSHQGHGNP